MATKPADREIESDEPYINSKSKSGGQFGQENNEHIGSDDASNVQSEGDILNLAAKALQEIASEIQKTDDGKELTVESINAQVQRYICALNGLNTTLLTFDGHVSSFSKDSVIYKILDEGWLEILMYTLQAPIGNELYLTAITTFRTLLVTGNICGKYTELPGFSKLIPVCISALSQIPEIFNHFFKEHLAKTSGDIGNFGPPPYRIQNCVHLMCVVGWILADYEDESLRFRWRSHMIQCGLVTNCIDIILSCDSVGMLDCATRCLGSVFQFRPTHDIVLRMPSLIDYLMKVIPEIYLLEPDQREGGGLVYIFMLLLQNPEIRRLYVIKDIANNFACTESFLLMIAECQSSQLAISSALKILRLIAQEDEVAIWMISHGYALDIMVNGLRKFDKYPQLKSNGIIVLHELLRESTVVNGNVQSITRDFLLKLSEEVTKNESICSFIGSLRAGSNLDTDVRNLRPAEVIEEPLFWLLYSLSRSNSILMRLTEVFPSDIPLACYVVARLCAAELDPHAERLTRDSSSNNPFSFICSWRDKKKEWYADTTTTMTSVSARQLLGQCDHCATYPRQQGTLKICSRCRMAKYCSQSCQRAAWRQHKKVCQPSKPSSVHI